MARRATRSKARQMLIKKSAAVRKELREIAYAYGREASNWLGIAVRDWQHKPRFAPTVIIQPGYIEVRINVAGNAKDIFKYVDQGTGLYGPKKRAYVIAPKDPNGFLVFQPGYSARTAPKAKIGMGTGQHFGPYVKKKEVLHPGIQGRHFTDRVDEELVTPWKDRCEQAISDAMKG